MWLDDCVEQGWHIVVYFTARNAMEQAALYAQGRLALDEVNRQRQLAGLWPITLAENATTVTQAAPGDSWHEYGLALDFVPLRDNGKPDWIFSPRDPFDIFVPTAQCAKAHGFVWGGDWPRHPDYGHIEYHPGLSIQQARSATAAGQPLVLTV